MPFEEFEKPPIPPAEEEEKEEDKAEEKEEVSKEEIEETELKEFEPGFERSPKEIKMSIDREWSRGQEQELNELKERNRERFEKLNFDIENLDLYVGDIHPNKGKCEAFSELIIIDKSILFDSKKDKDCAICHEISHYLINQKLPQEFFNRHPELRKKKQDLFKDWISKEKEFPPLMESDFMKRLETRYAIQEETTLDEARQILETFVEDFRKFKPKSTNLEIVKKMIKFGVEEEMMFDKKESFATAEEYERQAMLVLLQLGDSLSRKVGDSEARRQNINPLESHFIEEGACHYLAAKLLDISLDRYPYVKGGEISVARDWDRKLSGEIEPLIEAIKKGDFLKLYKSKIEKEK